MKSNTRRTAQAPGRPPVFPVHIVDQLSHTLYCTALSASGAARCGVLLHCELLMPGESTSISISTGADSSLANLDDPVSDTSSRLCDCPEEQLGMNIMDVGLIACVSATLLMGYCARSTCDVAEPAGHDLVRHGHHRVTPQVRTMASLLRRGVLPERVLSPGHEPTACAVCIEEHGRWGQGPHTRLWPRLPRRMRRPVAHCTTDVPTVLRQRPRRRLQGKQRVAVACFSRVLPSRLPSATSSSRPRRVRRGSQATQPPSDGPSRV